MEIKRNIFNTLCSDLGNRFITILVGARQVGKTFLMRKVEEEARRRGKSAAFFNLELPADARRFNASEEDLFDLLTSSGDVVFLDEFHYLKNASHLFKAVYDSDAPVKIFASGSSSLEIHKHLKESLAGRKAVHRVYPCSLGEMQGAGVTVEDYFLYGGMPGTIHQPDAARKKDLLADILQSYVIKDIKGLIREENVRAFNSLLYLLAQQQGGLVSVAALARDVGLTARTVESHLEILSQTYVCHTVPSFSRNLGNELRKSRKCYLFDLGVRNALLKDFGSLDRDDAGVLIESFVALELLKRVVPETELRFWRTKAGEEVDFVWVVNRRPVPIEVKRADCKGAVPKGLAAFLRRYPKTPIAFVLHGGEASDVRLRSCDIRFRPWRSASDITNEV